LKLKGRSEGFANAFAFLGHIFLIMLVMAGSSRNAALEKWRMPASAQLYAAPAQSPPGRWLSLFGSMDAAFDDPIWWATFLPGNIGVLHGGIGINGYSPIKSFGLVKNLCMDWRGQTCPEVAERLFAAETDGAPPLADLLKLDRLMIAKGPHLANFEAVKPAGWSIERENSVARIYRRDMPDPALPGSVSWRSAGTEIAPLGWSDRRESYSISAAPTGGRLVFARPWSRGFNVSLNGRALAPVPYRDLLIAVDLPPGATGILTLDYWPRGLTLGLWIAACALLLIPLAAWSVRPLSRVRSGPSSALP
jgi:hypothetical protein